MDGDLSWFHGLSDTRVSVMSELVLREPERRDLGLLEELLVLSSPREVFDPVFEGGIVGPLPGQGAGKGLRLIEILVSQCRMAPLRREGETDSSCHTNVRNPGPVPARHDHPSSLNSGTR